MVPQTNNCQQCQQETTIHNKQSANNHPNTHYVQGSFIKHYQNSSNNKQQATQQQQRHTTNTKRQTTTTTNKQHQQ